MGSGLGEKDTDDEKRRIGRTESAARAFCGKTDTVAYGSEEEKKDGKEITLAVYEYLVQEKIQEQLAELEQKFRKMENWHWRRNMHRFTVLFWSYSINSLNFWGRKRFH